MRAIVLLFLYTFLLFFISCEKESNKKENDLRLKYIGDWNFKGNGYSYSGYYIYDSLLNSQWTYDETFTTDYNDSTGTIELGENINEIIIKYCESCHPVIYNLNENGVEDWSHSYGASVGWTLTDSTFFKIVIPAPPSYSPSYSTYNVEGWKL